jgi:hypothetical protein
MLMRLSACVSGSGWRTSFASAWQRTWVLPFFSSCKPIHGTDPPFSSFFSPDLRGERAEAAPTMFERNEDR